MKTLKVIVYANVKSSEKLTFPLNREVWLVQNSFTIRPGLAV